MSVKKKTRIHSSQTNIAKVSKLYLNRYYATCENLYEQKFDSRNYEQRITSTDVIQVYEPQSYCRDYLNRY